MGIENIQGEERAPGGRHANERIRRRGLVPAVIYGHAQAPESVALSLHDLSLALQHQTHVINLSINGEETQYLIKEVQYDHLQATPIHVDLMRVDPTERVQVKVPIVLRGTAKGTEEGGVLVHVISELDVECLLLKIPGELRVRIDELGINDALHVRDLTLPEGVTVLNEPDDVVAVVQPPRGAPAEEEEAEAAEGEGEAEPEIISKGKEEEEQGEG